MITLQINTSGAWKNVLQFEPASRGRVLRGVDIFAGILESSATWCLLHEDGKREWLQGPFGPWHSVTAEQPVELIDVLVSTRDAKDDESLVYMAYRKFDGRWYLSGTPDQMIGGVYAYAEIIDPAPMAMSAVAT